LAEIQGGHTIFTTVYRKPAWSLTIFFFILKVYLLRSNQLPAYSYRFFENDLKKIYIYMYFIVTSYVLHYIIDLTQRIFFVTNVYDII